MADPRTRIVISAVDQTGAAFTSAKRRLSDLASSAAKVGSGFGGLGSALAGLTGIGGLTAALTGGGFIAAVKSAADAADRLDELSERTGVAVESLNGLDYAIKLSGGSTDELEKGLQSLNKKLSEVAAGDKSTAALFKSLRINATSAEEALLQLADVFPQMSKQDQVRIGTELLGKSYAALVPLLAQGRAELQGMVEEGQRLNPITAQMAREAAQFNDNLDKMRRTFDGISTVIGNRLLPGFNDILEFTQRAQRELGPLQGAFVGLFGGATLKAFGVELDGLKRAEADVQDLFAKRAAALQRLNEARADMESAPYGLNRRSLAQDVKAAQSDVDKLTADLNAAIKTRNALQSQAASRVPRPRTPDDAPALPTLTTPTKKTKAATEDALGDFLKSVEADAAAAEGAIARFRDIQLDAATAGADLTRAERQFLDLVNSPEWERLPEGFRDLVREEFEAANAASRAADEQQRLNELLNDSAVENQRKDMQLLARAYEEGRLGIVGSAEAMDRFNEAATRALGNAKEDAGETNVEMSEFAKQAAHSMQSAFADFLFDPFSEGLDGMLDGFARVVQRMIAEALAAELAQKLFGGLVSGGSGGGLIGAGLSFLSGLGSSGAPVSERSFTPVASAKGNAFAGAGLEAFAKGGAFGNGEVLTRPTLFRFAAGGAWREGVAGEAGPEGALPLKRMRNGKLGVYLEGGQTQIQPQQPTVVRPVISPEMANMTMREWVEGWLARELAGG